jgi:GT2 family glycosyltransferase
VNGKPRTAPVAVIIVNFNAGALLGRCLESLAGQELAPARVIVVDNASTDGSLRDLGDRFPWAELIVLQHNEGFAAANNRAAREAADCEWLALLNPDAFPEPGWLAALWRAARAGDGACYGSRMLRAGRADQLDGTGDVYHVSGLGWRRDHGAPAAATSRPAGEIFSPCAAAALYRRDAFLAVGGFDERFFCYFEDIDLGFRLRLAGHRCHYVPDAVVAHLGSATSGERSDFSIYYGHRNLVWTYFKNMPGWLFWRFLPQHVLMNIISVLWYSLRGRGGVILRAKAAALRGLPAALRDRRRVQAARRIRPPEVLGVMARGWLGAYFKRYA